MIKEIKWKYKISTIVLSNFEDKKNKKIEKIYF